MCEKWLLDFCHLFKVYNLTIILKNAKNHPFFYSPYPTDDANNFGLRGMNPNNFELRGITHLVKAT